MNMWGYAWGISGFLASIQICEGNNNVAIFFAAVSFVCLIASAMQDSDKK